MPPVSLSISALNPSISAAHSTDNGHPPRFKAQPGGIKRVWITTIKHKAQKLYVLVRGESDKSGIRKAEELSQRISSRADRVRTAIRNARDTHSARKAIQSDVEKLQRDEQKLQDLTHGAARLDTVLAEQSTNRYLQQTTPKQDKQRCKNLDALENSPLAKLRNESAALQRIWDTVQREKTLEDTKDRIPALYGLYSSYTAENGLPEMSIDVLKDLFSLSESLQKLSPPNGSAASFLYPALKLTYERNRHAPDGGNDRALQNMLRDLSNRNADKGARAQLGGKSLTGAIDFYLHGKLNISFSRNDHAAQRAKLVSDLDVLLNGMADAGRQIQRDELKSQTSTLARAVQADLVQETEVLYDSAQHWHALDGMDPILHMPPAAAVDLLVDEAIDQVLHNTAAGSHGPLVRTLTTHLSSATIGIDQLLKARQVEDYMTFEQIAGLRRDLLIDVVKATGIRSNIKQLAHVERSADPRSAIKLKPASTRNEPLKPIPLSFQTAKPTRDAVRIAKRQEEIVSRHKENLKREVTNVLVACLGNAQTIPAKKLGALIDAYNALKPDNETWHKLLGEVTAAPQMSKKLLALNTGVLRQHMLGQLNLLGEIEQNAVVNKGANQLLRDVWSSIKASTIQQEFGPSLEGLCAMLASLPGANGEARKELFRRINELRSCITVLNVEVNNDTLLNAVVRSLSNEDLGTLLTALATPGWENKTLRQMATESQPAYLPQTELGQLFADDLAGNHQGLIEKTDSFLFELNQAGLRQLDVRLGALKKAVAPGFNRSLFAEAGNVYQMLNTPKACLTNGASAAEELERLIRESIPQEVLGDAQGGLESKRPVAMQPARFVRTAYGYTTAAHIARKLRDEISGLQKELHAGQDVLQMANYRSHRVAQTWQNDTVKRILNESEIRRTLSKLHTLPDLRPDEGIASTPASEKDAYARIDDYNRNNDGYEHPRNNSLTARQAPLPEPVLTRRPHSTSTIPPVSPTENRRVRSWSSQTTVRPNSIYSDASRTATPTPLSSPSSLASGADMSSLMNYAIPGDDRGAERSSALYDTVPDETIPVDSGVNLVPEREAPTPPAAQVQASPPPAPPLPPTMKPENAPVENEQREKHSLMRAQLLARAAKRNAARSPESDTGNQPVPPEPAVVQQAQKSPTLPSTGMFAEMAARMEAIRKRTSEDSDSDIDSGNGSGVDSENTSDDDEWL